MPCGIEGALHTQHYIHCRSSQNPVAPNLSTACSHIHSQPQERPDFDTIATVLVKLEQHVKRERKNNLTSKLWDAAGSASAGAGGSAVISEDVSTSASSATTAVGGEPMGMAGMAAAVAAAQQHAAAHAAAGNSQSPGLAVPGGGLGTTAAAAGPASKPLS